MGEVCRLCRQESDHLESLQGIREGLPLSVLVMIICPIKIQRKDNMPNFICFFCLEIVLSAYKLRDESIESDRYFRDTNDKELLGEEAMEDVKPIDADPLPVGFTVEALPEVVENNEKNFPRKKSRTSSSTTPRGIQLDFRQDEEFPYEVDCYKSGKHKSSAWDYFGRLINKHGEIVESEANFYFCKLCVSDKRSLRKRYRDEKISTGMIFQHLRAIHGIDKETTGDEKETTTDTSDSDIPSKKIIKESPSAPWIKGLIFSCPKSDCGKIYKLKICLDIHLSLEHTGIADEEPANTEYRVDLTRKDQAKSMAWSYFGPLLNSDYELLDEEHNYCRLCVANGEYLKYVKSCSTGTLLHHLRDRHTSIKRQRKKFRT